MGRTGGPTGGVRSPLVRKATRIMTSVHDHIPSAGRFSPRLPGSSNPGSYLGSCLSTPRPAGGGSGALTRSCSMTRLAVYSPVGRFDARSRPWALVESTDQDSRDDCFGDTSSTRTPRAWAGPWRCRPGGPSSPAFKALRDRDKPSSTRAHQPFRSPTRREDL